MEEFAPDWTSLQFVPYSFDPRGWFAGSVDALLSTLRVASRRHVLVHEIWVGSHVGASWKARLVGARQRHATRTLFRRLEPRRVHTSTCYHVNALAQIGQPSRVLPLFGNVPVVPGIEPAAIPGLPAGALVAGTWGTLYPDWDENGFFSAFAQLAGRLGRPAALVAAGNIRAGGAAMLRRWAAQWRGTIGVHELGRRTAAELAAVFARFDFGVTSMPWNLAGKSGAAAALRDHGLQVIVTTEGKPLRGPSGAGAAEDELDGFVPFFRDTGGLETVLQKRPGGRGVDAVAERFLAELADSA
ncbi:MAG TPA: hypothetical protein VHE13_14335 [Opitutus sp.]|nr:hypothetical protein [Opitutus sp.]